MLLHYCGFIVTKPLITGDHLRPQADHTDLLWLARHTAQQQINSWRRAILCSNHGGCWVSAAVNIYWYA